MLPHAGARYRLVSPSAPPTIPATMKPRSLVVFASLFTAAAFAQDAKPLKVMLITGGCCHDYKAQTEILKTGLEERINVTVTQVHVDDKSTKPALPIYGNPDYAAGYDLVIHDECAADIKDVEVVKGVLKPHDEGTPAVALHCAMHSYRTGDFRKKVDTLGGDGSLWFEFLGLQSSGHGAVRMAVDGALDSVAAATGAAAPRPLSVAASARHQVSTGSSCAGCSGCPRRGSSSRAWCAGARLSRVSTGSSQSCRARLKVPQWIGSSGGRPSSASAFKAFSGPRWMSPQLG